MSYRTLHLDSDGAIDWLTLNRPKRFNSFTKTMTEELADYFQRRQQDHDTRIVVMRGAGKAFCAGLDLKQHVAGEDAIDLTRDGWLLSDIIRLMHRCPQPIIALVHGAASGGGLALALAADVRIAATSARMNGAFIKVGLTGTEMGVSYFLPRIVGQSLARELLYTGRFIDAERALASGLVSAVVEETKLEKAGQALANDMLATSPRGLRLTKRSLNAAMAAGNLDSALETEERGQILCLKEPAFEEGVTAFLEKRPPQFPA